MAASSPIRRTVDFTSRPVPRERPARAAARSRQLRKRSTSPGRQTYCPSSAYQNPKQTRFCPGAFRDFMSAMAADVMSAMTHPHCMDARGSPCSAPRRARCFSPEGTKMTPQWSSHISTTVGVQGLWSRRPNLSLHTEATGTHSETQRQRWPKPRNSDPT